MVLAWTSVCAQKVPSFSYYSCVFCWHRADATSNLITRLHHNVIRTGLRRIHLAYSRISLKVGTEHALLLKFWWTMLCVVMRSI